MADRTKVQRDKHEAGTERPREAKMARSNRPRSQDVDYGGKGARSVNSGTGSSSKPAQSGSRRGSQGRRTVQARNRPSRARRPAERLNRPAKTERAEKETDARADPVRQDADNAPRSVRRATNLSNEAVTSPDVSLEVAHGPEGEAHAGQDLREPRMIPNRKEEKDENARHPKGRPEQRPDDRAAQGSS